VRTKASVGILLLLSAALLSGCNASFGTCTKSAQITGDKIHAAGEQQDIESEKTSAQLQEDLRLATERARLAEEKVELEKQKREFAEERLKQLEKTDKDGNGKESSEDEGMGES
jgi:predicted small secreted protein